MTNDKADFTQGNILKKLVAFMMPVLGALILQAAYGAVDLLVVGRFGSTSGLSAVLISIINKNPICQKTGFFDILDFITEPIFTDQIFPGNKVPACSPLTISYKASGCFPLVTMVSVPWEVASAAA